MACETFKERLIDKAGGDYAIRRLGGLLLAKRLDKFPDLGRKARALSYTRASRNCRRGSTRPATVAMQSAFGGRRFRHGRSFPRMKPSSTRCARR